MSAFAKSPDLASINPGDARGPECDTLILSGEKSTCDRIEQNVKKLDQPRKLIQFGIQVVDTTDMDQKEQGVNLLNTNGGQKNPNGTTAFSIEDSIINISSSVRGLKQLSILANASKDEAKIMAEPTLTILDNGEGILFIGRKTYVQQALFNSNTVTAAPTPIDSGIKFKITGRVAENGDVFTSFEAEVGDIVGFGPSGFPVVNTRQLTSTLRVKPGEKIVCGGLKTTIEVNFSRIIQIPILKDIPLIKELFRTRRKEFRMQTVSIVLTPTVLTEEAAKEKEKEAEAAAAVGNERMPPPVLPKGKKPEDTKKESTVSGIKGSQGVASESVSKSNKESSTPTEPKK